MRKAIFRKNTVWKIQTQIIIHVNICIFKQRTKPRKTHTMLLTVITSGRLDTKEGKMISIYFMYICCYLNIINNIF